MPRITAADWKTLVMSKMLGAIIRGLTERVLKHHTKCDILTSVS